MDKWLENETVVWIISIALALVIWLQANNAANIGSQAYRTIHAVDVSWRNLPSGLAVESVNPSTVDVEVRAPNQQIANLDSSAVGAYVNLTGASAGRAQFYMDTLVPSGVEAVQTSPQSVTVVLEPIIDRSKAVTVQVSGTPADGYQAAAAVSSPATVLVHGPQSIVDRVVAVVVAASVGGATGDQVATVAPKPVDSAGKSVPGVTLVPAQVQVTVPVRQAVSTRSLPVSVTVQDQPATGYKVAGTTATPASVTVSGPSKALAALTQVVTAPVSVAGAKANVAATATLVLPDGVTSVSPTEVSVIVHITQNVASPSAGK